MRYWEDFWPGQVFDCGGRFVSKAEIVAFAREFDPQPFHLDDAHPTSAMYGGLIASGWHSCCIAMRLAVDAVLRESASLGSPGMDKIRFLKPLRPDMRVSLRLTVRSTVPSQNRADRGRVEILFELFDDEGALLMDFVSTGIFGRRTAVPAAAGD
ncbi:MAG: dehydratase [Alphaproteobacteria bacterium]|nr:dehydratase [Alphaproteobacteria bacterium]